MFALVVLLMKIAERNAKTRIHCSCSHSTAPPAAAPGPRSEQIGARFHAHGRNDIFYGRNQKILRKST